MNSHQPLVTLACPASNDWGIGGGHLSRLLSIYQVLADSSKYSLQLIIEDSILSRQIINRFSMENITIHFLHRDHFWCANGYAWQDIIKESQLIIIDSPVKIQAINNISKLFWHRIHFIYIETIQDSLTSAQNYFDILPSENISRSMYIENQIMRSEFSNLVIQDQSQNDQVLVLAGSGHDPSGRGFELASQLSGYGFDVLARFNSYRGKCISFRVLNEVKSLKKTYLQSKIVVTSCGQSCFEAYSMGCIVILYPTSDKEANVLNLLRCSSEYVFDESMISRDYIKYLFNNFDRQKIINSRSKIKGLQKIEDICKKLLLYYIQ